MDAEKITSLCKWTCWWKSLVAGPLSNKGTEIMASGWNTHVLRGTLCYVIGATAPIGPVARFLDHTQRRTTVSRTPLDEWSARRRDLYLTTLTTDKHPCPGGIRTHNLSKRTTPDLRLRLHGPWDQWHSMDWNIYVTLIYLSPIPVAMLSKA